MQLIVVFEKFEKDNWHPFKVYHFDAGQTSAERARAAMNKAVKEFATQGFTTRGFVTKVRYRAEAHAPISIKEKLPTQRRGLVPAVQGG